jgi:phosphatidylglycerophosphate synthase
VYKLKARFQKLAALFARSGMTANHATVLGWVMVALFAAALYLGLTEDGWRWALALVPVIAVLRLIFNALDGMLSRAQGTATATGEVLNEGSDIVGDTIAYGVLAFLPAAVAPTTSLLAFVAAMWAAEFFGVLGKALPGGRRRQESLGGGKPERTLIMSAFAIWALIDVNAALDGLPALLVAVAVLAALTAAVRIRASLRDADGKAYTSHTAYGV